MQSWGRATITWFKSNAIKIFFLLGFGLLYLAWNYETYLWTNLRNQLRADSLDSSWILALNWASSLHLRWLENNLVFTYGPLYYLDGFLMPEFHSHRILILTQFGLNLFYAACFTYVYSFFLGLHLGSKRWWIAIFVIAMLFFQTTDVSLIPLIVAFIFLPVIFSNQNEHSNSLRIGRIARYAVITFLLAVLPFIKFSHIYESFLFVLVMIGFLIYTRKFLDALLIGIFFVFFTLLTWVMATGESIASLLPYLASRLNMSGGYSEAMMLGFGQTDFFEMFILALLFFAVLTIVLIYFLLTKKWRWATAWMLPMIALFLGFKSAFVRADGHAYIFLSYTFLTALYYFYLVEIMEIEVGDESELAWREPVGRAIMPFLVLLVVSTFFFLGGKYVINSQLASFGDVFNPQMFSQKKDRQGAVQYYRLNPSFVTKIDTKKSIDIIPWDVALLYGYGLKWKPRPVIQSYASYTPTLDDLDAEFFKSADAPDQVIFSIASIDARYPLFDTPHTFRALLDNYDYVASAETRPYALLERKQTPLSRLPVIIGQKEYKFGQTIKIPTAADGHVFMSADIELTFLGKFLTLVYKPTILRVELDMASGANPQYRFIRDTGVNGLFVSRAASNLADVKSIFDEQYRQDIVAVRFIGDGWYESQIKVQFYKILFDK